MLIGYITSLLYLSYIYSYFPIVLSFIFVYHTVAVKFFLTFGSFVSS